MKANIAHSEKKRIVIAGGGLGGLELAFRLLDSEYQVVLVDRNNYHQFPPLIYQVASAGLEPSSISFPFRRLFQGKKDFFFRMANVERVIPEENALKTSVGTIHYDYLVFAAGATTNFFGNENIEKNTLPMKTVAEGMRLRNTILEHLELAETEEDEAKRQALLNIVIVGGGASGVEIAGAMAEMKKKVIPRDYPDLDSSKMNIYLVNADDRLLKAMDLKSSTRAEEDLTAMGVNIIGNKFAVDFQDDELILKDGTRIPSKTVIWVSGIRANMFEGFADESIGRAGRLITDRYSKVRGYENIFCIGDQAIVEGDAEYPMGHPQLAQVAMQQAKTLAGNLKNHFREKELMAFKYRNLGTMATIGRKCAVAEIGGQKFGGLSAWILWLVVHLRSILGVKNKAVILLNWMWNYFNYRQSLRLILRASVRKE
ncbi:NAD(P)/FAD-dependent oxidoreductase [Prevotella sp. HUN102]|uniref:NAD(P)/FAD-dependent oxidoreductase n=1 Tax=Prevotella sp. HUN102 TaxID=1392486 RepID=UPI00048BBC3F|nr:NAD(P)/FAD-dependent oxidoreductase [Prevotella sp. HUN102]